MLNGTIGCRPFPCDMFSHCRWRNQVVLARSYRSSYPAGRPVSTVWQPAFSSLFDMHISYKNTRCCEIGAFVTALTPSCLDCWTRARSRGLHDQICKARSQHCKGPRNVRRARRGRSLDARPGPRAHRRISSRCSHPECRRIQATQ